MNWTARIIVSTFLLSTASAFAEVTLVLLPTVHDPKLIAEIRAREDVKALRADYDEFTHWLARSLSGRDVKSVLGERIVTRAESLFLPLFSPPALTLSGLHDSDQVARTETYRIADLGYVDLGYWHGGTGVTYALIYLVQRPETPPITTGADLPARLDYEIRQWQMIQARIRQLLDAKKENSFRSEVPTRGNGS